VSLKISLRILQACEKESLLWSAKTVLRIDQFWSSLLMIDVTVKVLEFYPIDKLLQVTALILMLNCIKNGLKSSPELCLKILEQYFVQTFRSINGILYRFLLLHMTILQCNINASLIRLAAYALDLGFITRTF